MLLKSATENSYDSIVGRFRCSLREYDTGVQIRMEVPANKAVFVQILSRLRNSLSIMSAYES